MLAGWLSGDTVGWLVDWPTERRAGWLGDMDGGLAGWLSGGWLAVCLAGLAWLSCWLVQAGTCCSTGLACYTGEQTRFL